jgi:hypothetical protein
MADVTADTIKLLKRMSTSIDPVNAADVFCLRYAIKCVEQVGRSPFGLRAPVSPFPEGGAYNPTPRSYEYPCD